MNVREMSEKCPEQCPLEHVKDTERTALGQCLDVLQDAGRTPRAGGSAGAPPVPSRPYPSLSDQGTAGVGLSLTVGASFRTALTSELFEVLDRGVASLDETRNGHSWPRPRKNAIAQLVERYDEETCRQAAREAREIVQSQEFAPNVTGLFAKKCADIAAERLAVRDEIRKALA